jgi:Fe-S-cluster-containing dehydrogenase component
MLQRARATRSVLESIYRKRAIANCLQTGRLFSGLHTRLSAQQQDELLLRLRSDSELRTVSPGEVIIAQGDMIGRDAKNRFCGDFYIVRRGTVRVVREEFGVERTLASIRGGVSGTDQTDYFGHIALLGNFPEIANALQRLNRPLEQGRRTASCIALDDVEVVRVPGETLLAICDADEVVKQLLVANGLAMLQGQQQAPSLEEDRYGAFLDQGLFQAQRMLALDLERCTRCDECTKACADAHGDGHSRLLRDGLRFDTFLIASSCRSCHQPYCMSGCPVDSIHRGKATLEILIDQHCIGCGLCEKNCPYGAIQMIAADPDATVAPQTASVARKALNCDLCHDLVRPGADPFCVSACPHEAAYRLSGEEMWKRVTAKKQL